MGDSQSIHAGGRFGDLEIEAEIGAGSFGTVFRARDTIVGRAVALKVIRPKGFASVTDEFRKRFLREARALGSLAHVNIATLYHVHPLDDGGWALELEYVDGPSIDALISAGKRLAAADTLTIARGIAQGLRAAHAAQVVHGDIKPANVLRSAAGVIKIVDFGLARTLASESALSSSGRLSGTPHYLAPEIVEGGKHTPAGDVWGLGAMLYRVLSGRLPFDAESLPGLFFRVLNTEPPPLKGDVPVALGALVHACLAKRPEDRPAIDDRFFAALDQRKTPRDAQTAAPDVAPRRRDLIGREAELTKLHDLLARATTGSTQIVALTGAAGIGKSSLAGALEVDARARGVHAIHVVVTPNEGLLRPLHRALVAEGEPTVAANSGAASPGTDARLPKVPTAHLADVERRLSAMAAERTVLVVVEDIHRASVEDLRMLGRLVSRIDGGRVMFLLTERTPDLDATAGAAPKYEALLGERGARIDLGPLPREALRRLLDEAAGGEPPPDLAERAVVRSGGNPLFAVQLLSHAIESRAAQKKAGIDPRTASMSIEPPPMLRDLMVRRLRGIPENLREVLDAAAVAGTTFEAEALSRAIGHEPIDVLRRLQRLSRGAGLIVPLEHGYRFAHPLLQETVYAEVAPDLRRTLHRAYALDLETSGDDVDPERLGVHWERANEPKRAARHLLKAAAKAADRLEYWRCVDLATRAGVSSRMLGAEFVRDNVRWIFDVASVMGEIGRPSESDAMFDDVTKAVEALGDPMLGLQVAARRGLVRFLGSGLAEGDEGRLEAAARALPDSIERGIAHYTLGMIDKYRGRLAAAEEAFVRADQLFVQFDTPGRHGSAVDQLAAVAGLTGRPARAATLYREAARICRESGRLGNAEISEVNAVMTEIELGRIDGTVERLDRAARVLDADGGPVPAARIRVVLAAVRYALGDLDAARSTADRAARALGEIGMKAGIVEARTVAAELAIAVGDSEGARGHIAAGRDAAKSLGNRVGLLRFDFQEALLLTTEGREESAESAVRIAIESMDPDARASLDAETLCPLLDALVFGMRPSTGRMLFEATIATSPAEYASSRVFRAILDGVDAAAAADASRLDLAALALVRPDVGLRRAELHVIGETWRAIAARIRGNTADADRSTTLAVEAAHRLGHRPLERWALFATSGFLSPPD